jgi:hypothetical protein
MKPTTVIVHKSQSPFFFSRDMEISYVEFEKLAFNAAIQNHDNDGFTEVTVNFDTGISLGIEILLCPTGWPGAKPILKDITREMGEACDSVKSISSSLSSSHAQQLDLLQQLRSIDYEDEENPA